MMNQVQSTIKGHVIGHISYLVILGLFVIFGLGNSLIFWYAFDYGMYYPNWLAIEN